MRIAIGHPAGVAELYVFGAVALLGMAIGVLALAAHRIEQARLYELERRHRLARELTAAEERAGTAERRNGKLREQVPRFLAGAEGLEDLH